MIFFVFLFLVACAKSEPATIDQESYVFGTRVQIRIASQDSARAQDAIRAIFLEFDRLHQKFHPWKNQSFLMQQNAKLSAGQALTFDQELHDLIVLAQHFERESDGLFNASLGRVVALWGFHADDFVAKLPDAVALAALQHLPPSSQNLVLRDGVFHGGKHEALDFGGMLKGRALDFAAQHLKQVGLSDALINIGGNVLALGSRFGKPWRVGIQDARRPAALAIVALQDGEAIATSGDYQRYFELDGERFCHLIDPRTLSAKCARASATVLVSGQDAGLRSDILSKPFYFAKNSQRIEFKKKFSVVGFLIQEADGRMVLDHDLEKRLTWARDGVDFVLVSR